MIGGLRARSRRGPEPGGWGKAVGYSVLRSEPAARHYGAVLLLLSDSLSLRLKFTIGSVLLPVRVRVSEWVCVCVFLHCCAVCGCARAFSSLSLGDVVVFLLPAVHNVAGQLKAPEPVLVYFACCLPIGFADTHYFLSIRILLLVILIGRRVGHRHSIGQFRASGE